ncbi:DUF1015 domain-containing protein [Thermoleophilia bacterium SCSIO 60948]|nr:DUF1015 domain-containing protein [Thermoleophilia bacterium SCSIO 60948]
MADVAPINAVRYDPTAVPSLGDVVAPPYDVIDAAKRRELLGRSPFNVVEVDLPEAPAGEDPYARAAETIESWKLQGVLATEREPSMWALAQDYTGPDGQRRTRKGIILRSRVTGYGPGLVRPHERTQPGPKEDRLRLTRATKLNLSPIFSLSDADAWRHVAGYTRGEPWAEVTEDDGTVNRVWRIDEPTAHSAVASELSDSELLIADGHHRYETARTYADEIGGDGPQRWTLNCVVSLSDPGLTVFGYHRLLSGLTDTRRQLAIRDALFEFFDLEQLDEAELDPAGEDGVGVFGYIDSHFRQGYRLRLKDPDLLDGMIPERSEPYRRLDAAILEEVVFKRGLGMSDEDIAAKRGLGYAKGAEETLAQLSNVPGEGYDAAFLLRPTPVEAVRAVAREGETMPPKSTYFFPKLLTGFVFNPVG